MAEQDVIWECRVSDGIRQYFYDRSEAEFFAKDTMAAGFTVRTQPISLPQTAKEFAAFMEREFNSQREVILAIKRSVERDYNG